jgi:hypothetical protein
MVCAGGLRVPRSARNAANHSGREPSVSSAGPGHPRCRQYFIDDRDHPRIPNVLKDSAIGGFGGSGTSCICRQYSHDGGPDPDGSASAHGVVAHLLVLGGSGEVIHLGAREN